MTIEIPGYYNLIPNQAYARDIIHTYKDKKMPAKEIMLISRYAFPEESRIRDFFCDHIKKNDAARSNVIPLRKTEKEELEGFVNSIPEDVLVCFAGGGTPFGHPEKRFGAEYFHAIAGKLPASAVFDSSEGYEEAFFDSQYQNVGCGEQLFLDIILKNGALLPEKEIEFLIGHGVICSEAFSISDHAYPKKELRKLVSSLYSALSSSDDIKKLRDCSETVFEGVLFDVAEELDFSANAR